MACVVNGHDSATVWRVSRRRRHLDSMDRIAGGLVGGSAVPLVKGIVDMDALPFAIALFLQSMTTTLFLGGWCIYSECKKHAKVNEFEPNEVGQQNVVPGARAALMTKTTTP
mmetsp:Transcript_8858/g.16927  ORF Transcript_8858/g.16927 Transcript_8858/m.16927 type:complete len:112 (+) Transcript_8858:899-1234(+)